METINIYFTKWDKWQGRQDIKVPWWFKFDQNFYTNSTLLSLSNDEKHVFIFLLCEANKQRKKGHVSVPTKLITSFLNISDNIIFDTLKKLSDLELLQESVRDPYAIRTRSVQQIRLDQIRLEKNIGQKTKKNEPQHLVQKEKKKETTFDQTKFDPVVLIEKAYNQYPRKIGKQKGIQKLKKQIKSETDYTQLVQAIKNYKEFTKNKDVDYIKHFSTFVTDWREWINPEFIKKQEELEF